MESSKRLSGWLQSWFALCLLRRAPQDDPLSYAALLLALLIYIGIDLLIALASSEWGVALGMTLVDVLFMAVFTGVALRIADKLNRFSQTLTALAGSGAVLGLLALPVVQQASAGQRGGEAPGVLALLWLVLLVWSVAVRAHVFRHALSLSFGAGVLVALLHAVLVFSLVEYLFPRVV